MEVLDLIQHMLITLMVFYQKVKITFIEMQQELSSGIVMGPVIKAQGPTQ